MKIKNIYIEKQIEKHKNTKRIVKNIKFENIILCDHYSQIFNTSNQSFRIQKKFPSLILAKKENNFIFKTPNGFNIGFKNNYYFSHMLNCPYDCKYCYLQGMFNSANYLVFVNYEDFYSSIKDKINETNETTCFFSGYDCDSLALENITNFLNDFLKYFKDLKKGVLEIRSKSVNINVLKNVQPLNNVIPAFSLNPQFVIEKFEDKTPDLSKRLNAIKSLQKLGWNIGLRFDPLIWFNKQDQYKLFFSNIFDYLDTNKIHSVTLGAFRMPSSFLKKIANDRPYNYLIQMGNSKRLLGIETSDFDENKRMFCKQQIMKFIPKEKVFIN